MARLRLGAALACAAVVGCGAGEPGAEDIATTRNAVRPDTPGASLQFKFNASDVVETHQSSQGRFLVHFTRNGSNAVPAADGDNSGVPDFAEDVAETYESVLTHYESLGFSAPLSDAGKADNGGDGAFDVYLVDFAGVGDGNFQKEFCTSENPQRCSGYMVQENDYVGYGYPSTQLANRILCSHEFFHAVQAAYDTEQGSVFSEGSAVWATESFDASLKDFEGFLGGYFQNPDRSLDVPLPGPVDPFSYGSGIFFQFLEERHGAGTVRGLWQAVENGSGGVADPYWLTALDPLLATKGSSFAETYTDFATWNLMTALRGDPSRSYAAGKSYPPVKLESVDAPYSKDKLRVFYASAQYYRLMPGGRAEMTAALVNTPTAPNATEGLSLLLASRSGSLYDPVVRVADVAAGTETVATASAAELVVIVVNPKAEGESARPGLCIGTADEVTNCRNNLSGAAGGGGAAGSAGSGGTAGTASNAAKDDGESGCGCRTVRRSPLPLGPWLLGLGLAYSLCLRRRSRRPLRRRR